MDVHICQWSGIGCMKDLLDTVPCPPSSLSDNAFLQHAKSQNLPDDVSNRIFQKCRSPQPATDMHTAQASVAVPVTVVLVLVLVVFVLAVILWKKKTKGNAPQFILLCMSAIRLHCTGRGSARDIQDTAKVTNNTLPEINADGKDGQRLGNSYQKRYLSSKTYESHIDFEERQTCESKDRELAKASEVDKGKQDGESFDCIDSSSHYERHKIVSKGTDSSDGRGGPSDITGSDKDSELRNHGVEDDSINDSPNTTDSGKGDTKTSVWVDGKALFGMDKIENDIIDSGHGSGEHSEGKGNDDGSELRHRGENDNSEHGLLNETDDIDSDILKPSGRGESYSLLLSDISEGNSGVAPVNI